MAAFQFRLAALLRLRERIQEAHQWELGALNRARQIVEAEIAGLERQLTDLDGAMGVDAGEFLSIVDLKIAAEAAQVIDRRIKKQRLAMIQLDGAIAVKKGELVEAMREVMSLERLRERQAEIFRHEQDATEQKSTDEVARRKFVVDGGRKNLPQR